MTEQETQDISFPLLWKGGHFRWRLSLPFGVMYFEKVKLWGWIHEIVPISDLPSLSDALRAMGIRDRPTAPRSRWQNAYVERLIGSMRRECLDHMIVFGEAHLRRILGAYAAYYNKSRTHRSMRTSSLR